MALPRPAAKGLARDLTGHKASFLEDLEHALWHRDHLLSFLCCTCFPPLCSGTFDQFLQPSLQSSVHNLTEAVLKVVRPYHVEELLLWVFSSFQIGKVVHYILKLLHLLMLKSAVELTC